jgi:hypothetical protein
MQINLGFAEPVVDRRTMRDIERERLDNLARSPAVTSEVMAVFMARPEEWLNYGVFHQIKEKYDLGFDFGTTLRILVRDGKIEEKHIYHGAESPGMTKDLIGKRKLKKGEKPPLPYMGYYSVYRLKEVA